MHDQHSNDAPAITFLKGMAIGTADIIPGVSGGTMAFILGIYGRLLAVINAVNWRLIEGISRVGFRASLRSLQPLFLMPLLGGIVCGLMVMIHIIGLPTLLHTHPQPVYGLFFGLIVASVMVLLKSLPKPWRLRDALDTALGIAFGYAVVSLVPTNTPDASWFYVVCGAVSISAMLLPGISGSFMLLILGKYTDVMNAFATMDLDVLMPFALGCGIGLAACARAISWLLAHYHRSAILVICGILIGTLKVIWPFQERVYDEASGVLIASQPLLPAAFDAPDALLTYGMMAAGFALLWAMEWWAGRKV